MKMALKGIGILTAGGDCPGLNAVIRAVTKTAIHDYGIEVFGIQDGFEGPIEKRGHRLTSEDVSGILTHGGTILGTSNTSNPFKMALKSGPAGKFVDRSAQVLKNFKAWNLQALIAVGGDGTLKIARKLLEMGMPVVGIPKTIDNDLSGTDLTFGFDSAVTIATDALDRLHTTAASHHRVMILEVMGRHAGWIALYSGAAGGADVILIPEIPFTVASVSAAVKKRHDSGKKFSLMVVAEGAFEKGAKPQVQRLDKKNPYPEKLGGIGNYLMNEIEHKTGIETRVAVLGHIQRGGSPTPFDRNLGTLFGKHAVELVVRKQWGTMVSLQGQHIGSVPIAEAVSVLKTIPLDHALISAARSVGTEFGE